MGRFKIAGVISVGLLVVSIVSCQHKPQNLTCNPGNWCQINNDLWFAYVPNFQTPAPGTSTYPEFAVLRMSNTYYQQFYAACTGGTGAAFLNHFTIFSHKLNIVLSGCPQTAAPQNGAPYSYVMVPHWPNSTAAATGYPETSP